MAKFGDWFSYERTPRALIFKRDHPSVKDVASMTKLMRYNNFKKDPLSKCDCSPPYSAENAISARNDLNPKNGTYPFGALGHRYVRVRECHVKVHFYRNYVTTPLFRSHGGTDMKLTTSGLAGRLEFVAAGGPTFDDLPPFQWSKADFAGDTPHFGHPDLWQFEPITHAWTE